MHGVVFHAFHYHHFPTCCGDPTSLQMVLRALGCKPWRKATFCAYSSFIGMKFNKDTKVWTYLPIAQGPLDWCKFWSSCTSFKIWLWGVNLSFNLTLNALQGKLPIRFGSASFCVIHHFKAWSFKRDYINLSRSTSVLIIGIQNKPPFGSPTTSPFLPRCPFPWKDLAFGSSWPLWLPCLAHAPSPFEPPSTPRTIACWFPFC